MKNFKDSKLSDEDMALKGLELLSEGKVAEVFDTLNSRQLTLLRTFISNKFRLSGQMPPAIKSFCDDYDMAMGLDR